MFATIINDCHCYNARGRQETRLASLLNCGVNFIKVNSDIEAAGNLVDVLDAGFGSKGVVLVNVPPRNGRAKKWKNGTPFGYFYYGETLIISTIDGLTLSLVKKMGVTNHINVINLEETVRLRLVNEGKEELKKTQFKNWRKLG